MVRARPGSRGFTLLEILVVMALIGLVAAMVAPNLQKLAASMERHSQRESVLAEIAALSYRAYVTGRSFELAEDKLGTVLPDGNPMVALPSGWRLRIATPVRYNFNGLCAGGELTLLPPDASPETLALAAPDCRVEDHGR